MLDKATPYFTLIMQSPILEEVERAAEIYQKSHLGAKIVIDRCKDYLEQCEQGGLWRARAWITVERTLFQQFIYTLRR